MFEHLDKPKQNQDQPQEFKKIPEPLVRANIESMTSGRSSALSPLQRIMPNMEARMKKLEEKGRKRGKRFSLIGILGGSLIALCIIYFGYLLLSDVINLSGEIDENEAVITEMNRSLEEKTAAASAAKTEQVQADAANIGMEPVATSTDVSGVFAATTTSEIPLLGTENASGTEATINESAGLCASAECAAADSDSDGLSDQEELDTYLTDPQLADTDNDGYSDGAEVANGYNPKGK